MGVNATCPVRQVCLLYSSSCNLNRTWHVLYTCEHADMMLMMPAVLLRLRNQRKGPLLMMMSPKGSSCAAWMKLLLWVTAE